MKNRTNTRISLINAALLTAVSLLSIAAIAIPEAHAAMLPAEQCDAEAGSAHDLQRNLAFAPVETGELRIGLALSACREAVNQGGGPRQAFQLARVLHAAGQRSQAFALLQEAAEDGYAVAMVNYAVMLGERGDEAAEIALYRKAAATGNILAAYNLGVAYRDGVGTVPDGGQAAEWFERASAVGSSLGAFNLAVLFDEGTLVAEDNAKAARFYRLAADRGNVDAMVNLGLMLENGEGVERDAAAAAALFSRAAETGDDFAILKLAVPQIDPEAAASIEPSEQALLVLEKAGRLK